MVDALSTGLPVAEEHLQILERLRQLTAWQQAQQERLRAHQQQQIARLRGTPPAEEPPSLSASPSPPTGGENWSGLQQMRGEGEGERGNVSDSGLETGGHGSEEESQPRQPLVAREDRPIQPGVGEGGTFEDLLERQLRLQSTKPVVNKVSPGRSLQNKPRPFLRRGKGLARFGGGHSSPRSRHNKPPNNKPRKAPPASLPASGHAHQVMSREGPLLGSRFSSDESFIIRGSQRVQQEEAELVEFEQLEKEAFDTSSFSQCSLVTALVGGERGGVSQSGGEGRGSVDGEKERGGEDLDKTLTPSQTEVGGKVQSLAAGLVFSDDEEWESFSHSSPPPPPHSSQLREWTSGSPSPLASPSKQEHVSSTPLPSSPPPQHPSPEEHLSREATPPPSTLTAKLFPALRQERERHLKPKPVEEKTAPPGATPPRYPSESEVRERLGQLETEIERFRRLNSRLEQQTREKEESLGYLKREIAEFQQQMKLETEQFETYKREEARKLKKERRVFEVYVQESRAGQERRDREEMESLKSQVRDLQEELGGREERWRAALARQRQRVEALEGQNRELQADLRMMERERLAWWQEQLERKRQTTPSPPPPLVTRRGGGGKRPGRGRSDPAERKSPPNMRAESGAGGGGGVGERDGQTAPLTIVEVVSRDLSPPQSDLCSGSEAGSDVSALAEEIVERIMGPRGGGWGQEVEFNRGQSSADEGLKIEKCGGGKSVRFAVDPVATDGDGEREAGPQKQEPEEEMGQEERSKVMVCANGTRREVSSDGRSVSLTFTNGDTKHIKPNGTVVYFYCQSRTTHITHPDGMEEILFPNQQREKLFPNGQKEVWFPDGTAKTVEPGGEEESVFADGTVQRLLVDGSRVIHYPNGQRETHTKEFKRREYLDGTVKTVFPDGRQETRYSSGRLRVKNSSGNVLVDSWNHTPS